MLNALLALIEQVKINKLTLSNTSIDRLMPKVVPIVNQFFLERGEALIHDKERLLCLSKNYASITKDKRMIILELIAILITYMIKSETPLEGKNAFYKSLLAPEAPDDINAAKKAFNELGEWPLTSTYSTLDKLPGRGISFPFTGQERMNVSKNRLGNKKNSQQITITIKHPSPLALLGYQNIGPWRHLRGILKDNLDLILAKEKDFAHVVNVTLSKIVKKTFQSRSTLVQDFSPGAAKYLTEYLYPNKNNLVGCDPCGGWGDRLTGWLATNKMNKVYINDTNPTLVSIYPEMVKGLAPKTQKEVVITAYKAEEFYEQLEVKFQSDIIITSPPYFAKENYRGENASHNQYQTSEDWINSFLFPFSKQMSLLAKENSYACILINDVNYYDDSKEKGNTSNCIPLINKTIEAFTSNNFDFEGKLPYGSSQLKTPKKSLVKREGEMFLIFKRKNNTPPLSASKQGVEKYKNDHTVSLLSCGSIPFFSSKPEKRRLRLYIGSQKTERVSQNSGAEEKERAAFEPLIARASY